MISKMRTAHFQRIKDIPFLDIFEPHQIVSNIKSEGEAFEAIYPGLIRNANMENILKIEKFVEKLVGSNKFKDRIYWDFVMKLPEDMDSEMYDKEHTIEQVKYGCLPKIDVKLMNERFSDF